MSVKPFKFRLEAKLKAGRKWHRQKIYRHNEASLAFGVFYRATKDYQEADWRLILMPYNIMVQSSDWIRGRLDNLV